MIAWMMNICLKKIDVKKFITPDLRPLRALFFLLSLVFPVTAFAQKSHVDSLIEWVETHPHNDSARIRAMHSISYMLSESDVKRSFYYYGLVSRLSDSLNFTFGKALGNINLGILLSSSGNFEASTKAYFKAIDEARECGAARVEAVALHNIGENFASLKDYERCRQYVLQAIP